MAQEEMKWGIYINYGYQNEFEAAKKAKFTSKRKAIHWCKSNPTKHTYPEKCVMRISEILEINPNYYD